MKPSYTLAYLNYLESEIKQYKPPTSDFKLKDGEYITDVEKVVSCHVITIKKYIHNNVGKPYMRRMYELLEWLKKNGEKIS